MSYIYFFWKEAQLQHKYKLLLLQILVSNLLKIYNSFFSDNNKAKLLKKTFVGLLFLIRYTTKQQTKQT